MLTMAWEVDIEDGYGADQALRYACYIAAQATLSDRALHREAPVVTGTFMCVSLRTSNIEDESLSWTVELELLGMVEYTAQQIMVEARVIPMEGLMSSDGKSRHHLNDVKMLGCHIVVDHDHTGFGPGVHITFDI